MDAASLFGAVEIYTTVPSICEGLTMTVTKDLFLAILAMDAYNRGYKARINLGVASSINAKQSLVREPAREELLR